MHTELHPAEVHRAGAAYQMLLFVDSDTCASDSFEMAALRLLHDEGLIRVIESCQLPSASVDVVGEYEVDADLYSFVYGLLHPERDGCDTTPSCTDTTMQVAKAVRYGADIFVTDDSDIANRDRPFERQTDMHLLEPTQALELVMQEIHNAD